MNLLIDIGNTRAKWRYFDGVVCGDQGVLENAELSEKLIEELMERYSIKKIFISSVGKDDIVHLFACIAQSRGLEFAVMQSQSVMSDVKFAYQDISSLGVDRCLAMVAAYEYKGVLIIDAGSAITADYVAEDGSHKGGYILPGCQMLKTTLNMGTSRIAVKVSLGNVEPGTSTSECVGNGLTLMLQALMQGLIERANILGIEEYIVTGGDAELLASLCPDIAFIKKNNLVLDGLQKMLTEVAEFEGKIL